MGEMEEGYTLVNTQKIGKYTISIRWPNYKPIEPYDFKADDARIAEIKGIIKNAFARDFRQIQSNEIRELFKTRKCPKCGGRLNPSEDGMECFTCGLVIYKEMYGDDKFGLMR